MKRPADIYAMTDVKPEHQIASGKPSTVLLDQRCPRPPSAYPVSAGQPEELKRIDYVLVYPNDAVPKYESAADNSDARRSRKIALLREQFERCLTEEGLLLERETSANYAYLKVHCPFWRMSQEAERMRLEMPLKGMKLNVGQSSGCLASLLDRAFFNDSFDAFACAPFEQSKLDRFEDSESPIRFFRPALRSLMVHNILSEIDVTDSFSEEDDGDAKANPGGCVTGKHGLQYLLMKEAYTDAYILHDECVEETSAIPRRRSLASATPVDDGVRGISFRGGGTTRAAVAAAALDERRKLDALWPRICAYLPLQRIRNYFGEEIALYFAWSGMLMFSVLVPAVFGVAIFFYGLWLSLSPEAETAASSSAMSVLQNTSSNVSGYIGNSMQSQSAVSSSVTSAAITTTESFIDILQGYGEDVLNTIQWALDNEITPWYSVVMCLWGTLFLEVWKRRSSVLSCQWHVGQFESNELVRPQFRGEVVQDPVTGEAIFHYSLTKRIGKYLVSFSLFLVMICVVLIVSTSMIVYRIVLGLDYCATGAWTSTTCTVVTSLCGTVANGAAIILLGKVYTLLAYKLTDWENHKTETDYKDSLIVKLFAFLFANSYTSLYYIAFFRGNDGTFGENGILGLGAKYRDNCGNDGNCMSMLSLQVLVLIVMKPLPKVIFDVIVPWAKKRIGFTRTRVVSHRGSSTTDPWIDFLEKERQKPKLEDFTLQEYTEKVLQYGYLMLFAVSMPLAPLIVLLTHVMDRLVDSKRMLWLYRRPVAYIAQDIGVWYDILEMLNVCGVITNALLIAFTSSWRVVYLSTPYSKLMFVLIFEHCVFAIKYLISYLIPDMPGSVKLALKQEKHLAAKAMESGRFVRNLARSSRLGLAATPRSGGDVSGVSEPAAKCL